MPAVPGGTLDSGDADLDDGRDLNLGLDIELRLDDIDDICIERGLDRLDERSGLGDFDGGLAHRVTSFETLRRPPRSRVTTSALTSSRSQTPLVNSSAAVSVASR